MTKLKYMGFYLILLVLVIFICSVLNLLGVNSTITNLLLLIFNIVVYFVFGLINGKNATSKGYLAGLKIALVMLGILVIINLVCYRVIHLSTIIYYVILLLCGITGGMMGINKKKKE